MIRRRPIMGTVARTAVIAGKVRATARSADGTVPINPAPGRAAGARWRRAGRGSA